MVVNDFDPLGLSFHPDEAWAPLPTDAYAVIDKALDSPPFEKRLRVAAVKACDHPRIITYVVNNEKRYFIGPVSMKLRSLQVQRREKRPLTQGELAMRLRKVQS